MFRIFRRLSSYSLINTLRFNFTVFPFHIARDLHIKICKNVTMIGLKKGCVILRKENTLKKRYVSEIGTTRVPMMSPKGCHTLLRFGTNSKLIIGIDNDIASGCSIIITSNGVLELGNNIFINQNTLFTTVQQKLEK